MTNKMTPELIESLAAGYNAILESQHTARAIQVNRLVADIVAQLEHWIDAMVLPSFESSDYLYMHSPQNIDFRQGLIMLIYFGTSYKNPRRAQYIKGFESGAGFAYAPKDSGYPPLLRISVDRFLGHLIEESPANLPDGLTVADIIESRERLSRDERNGEFVKLLHKDVVLMKYMFSSGRFIHTLRHELTHYVQWLNDEIGDSSEYFRKAGLPKSSITGKYHDILPWEIDAGIHGNLIEIIEGADKRSITEMAMHYMKYVFEPLKGTRYKKNPALEKQCWDTAISLCRAIKMAKTQHPGATPEEIIKYLDDYAI
jgi:hypothetical protein